MCTAYRLRARGAGGASGPQGGRCLERHRLTEGRGQSPCRRTQGTKGDSDTPGPGYPSRVSESPHTAGRPHTQRAAVTSRRRLR